MNLSPKDPFEDIASSILISDAELALTFIELGLSRSDGEEKRRAFRHAAHAYRSICESTYCIRMNQPDAERLGAMLREIEALLADTNCAA
jgi:hypothetical protein